MTKFNTDLAQERLQSVGESNGREFMAPWDYFYEGILYGMELANKKEQENMEGSTSQGTHYFYTATIGPSVVENYFPTKEEAEKNKVESERILRFFKELFKCEVSEVIERQGKIEEAYCILPDGEKLTSSDVKNLFLV